MPSAPFNENTTSFKANVLRLVSGTGLVQIISILSIPFLTRLYGPEAFGIEALFLSVTSVVGVLACGRYELSIVLPDDDKEAANLLAASLLIVATTTLLTTIFIWLCGSEIFSSMKIVELTSYRWMIPTMVMINGIALAVRHWKTRQKQFGQLSVARVVGGITSHSGKLSSGYYGYTTGGAMIAASIGGEFLSTFILSIQLCRESGKEIIQDITLKDVRLGLWRYRNFPIYGSWSILLGTGAWKLPVFLLGLFFSPQIIGFYALGLRIFQMPINLISNSIGQVFLESATRKKSLDEISILVKRLFETLVSYALFPILILAIVGEELYTISFGQAWSEAGLYTQIMSIWAFFWFISSAFTQLFSVLERQKLQLKWNVLNFTARLFAIVIGGLLKSPLTSIILLSIFGIIIYGYKIFLILDLVNIDFKAELLFMLKHFLVFIPAGTVLIILNYFDFEVWSILATAGFFIGLHIFWLSFFAVPPKLGFRS